MHVTNFSLFIGRLEYIWYRENKNEDFDSMTHKKNFDTSKCCHGARKTDFQTCSPPAQEQPVYASVEP